jgi:hypothetical protein
MRSSLRAALALAALATTVVAAPQAGAQDAVRYTLTGRLIAYTAPTPGAPGTATIAVAQGYRAGKPFTGWTMTFPLDASTRIHGGAAAPVVGDAVRFELHAAAGLDCGALEQVAPTLLYDELV